MVLPAGARLGPYEIESLIGSGGMGEVYKARDTRLNRLVAIKRISVANTERFQTEARAVAALNHPHICQIYDVGPDYLVLEYLQGDSLRGPVSPDQAVHLAMQIADALEAAHERGVIHRDLKPANIMVIQRSGSPSAKLLDFGIARLTGTDVNATITAAGGLLGTPAYMSPEQAESKPLDERSDVFSFGAVLYELISGQRAFAGDSTATVLSALLRDEPRPIDTPPALQQLVSRCLAKDPTSRFQTMGEVKRALSQVSIDDGEIDSSIAVLPFANLSADKDNEYFGDGLAEEIINALAQVEGLKVIARTSAFSFKGKNEDVRRIAQTLGVTNILEGSVRRAGDRVRITVQLIAAGDGTQLWSQRYDRPMTDIFATQDDIAQAITTALKGKLGAASPQRTPSVSAYETFLKGRAQLIRFTPEAWNRAMTYFERAIAIDPQYADPHVEMALGYFISGMHGLRPMREVAPLVRAEANRALRLNPVDQHPRFVLGAIALAHDYDWAAAEAHFAASMSTPNVSAYARWAYAGLYLRGLGRFHEAVAQMDLAVEQDPLNATWHAILGAQRIDTGRIDEAIAALQKAKELEPNYFVAEHLLGVAYWAAGRRHEALAAFELSYELAPWNAVPSGLLAAATTLMGDKARGDALIRQMGDAPRPLWGRVAYHILVSELEEAADWYEKMIEHREPFALVYALGSITAPLRAHPRWRKLAEMMRMPS